MANVKLLCETDSTTSPIAAGTEASLPSQANDLSTPLAVAKPGALTSVHGDDGDGDTGNDDANGDDSPIDSASSDGDGPDQVKRRKVTRHERYLQLKDLRRTRRKELKQRSRVKRRQQLETLALKSLGVQPAQPGSVDGATTADIAMATADGGCLLSGSGAVCQTGEGPVVAVRGTKPPLSHASCYLGSDSFALPDGVSQEELDKAVRAVAAQAQAGERPGWARRKEVKRRAVRLADSACRTRVVFDCAHDHLMAEKDICKLAHQISTCYAINRRLCSPVQFCVTGLGELGKELLERKARVEMKRLAALAAVPDAAPDSNGPEQPLSDNGAVILPLANEVVTYERHMDDTTTLGAPYDCCSVAKATGRLRLATRLLAMDAEHWDMHFYVDDYTEVFPADSIVYLCAESAYDLPDEFAPAFPLSRGTQAESTTNGKITLQPGAAIETADVIAASVIPLTTDVAASCSESSNKSTSGPSFYLNDVYVLGGLVDHNHELGYCYRMACERHHRTARLPIARGLAEVGRRLAGRAVLSLVHAFGALAPILAGGEDAKDGWAATLAKALPPRKLEALQRPVTERQKKEGEGQQEKGEEQEGDSEEQKSWEENKE